MYEVTMPKLSDSMEEGKIIEWKVKAGDTVKAGDVLAEVESDKAVMELEAFRDGVIAEIKHGDDSEVRVGAVIALIDAEGGADGEAEPQEDSAEEAEEESPNEPEAEEEPEEEAESEEEKEEEAQEKKEQPEEEEPEEEETKKEAKPEPKKKKEKKKKEEPKAERSPEPQVEKARPEPQEKASTPTPEAAPPGFKIISPYAKKLADDAGIDYHLLQGSGPDGRIVADDVKAAIKVIKPGAKPLEKPPRPRPDDELPELDVADDEADIEEMSFRLKTQALRVVQSKHLIPHFYITRGADVTRLLKLRATLKEKMGVTVTHLVAYACVKALEANPSANWSYDRGRIIKWKGVNLGLAVATDQGLTVAVIRDAGALSFEQLVATATDLVGRARKGKLRAEERRHPSFTLTNLGMFDIEHFEPIINPPSAITLAVASALPDTVVRDGEIFIGQVMKLSASCDHRIVDGATAARFLASLVESLEAPEKLVDA